MPVRCRSRWAEAKRLFDALAEGGQIQQPLMQTFFSSSFGMLADRFDVSWMVVAGPDNCLSKATKR